MGIDRLKTYAIEQFRTAREELQSIPSSELTKEKITNWHTKWHQTFNTAFRLGLNGPYAFTHATQLAQDGAPPDVLVDVRAVVVRLIDDTLHKIDSTQTIETPLKQNIDNIGDPKLAALLNEFDRIKDIAPNSAGVILRTILMCIIYKRAELKRVTNLASYKVFNLGPMIDRARNDHLFERSDERFLEHFSTSGKAVFDNVAHSPDPKGLAEKDELESTIIPLNRLLETIRTP